MNINEFMIKLLDELYENLFYGVELYKEFNNYDKTYLLRVIAKRDNKRYDYEFSIHEKWLNNNSIDEIVNQLLGGGKNEKRIDFFIN